MDSGEPAQLSKGGGRGAVQGGMGNLEDFLAKILVKSLYTLHGTKGKKIVEGTSLEARRRRGGDGRRRYIRSGRKVEGGGKRSRSASFREGVEADSHKMNGAKK